MDRNGSSYTIVSQKSRSSVSHLCLVNRDLWCGVGKSLWIWSTNKTQPKKEIAAHDGNITSIIYVEDGSPPSLGRSHTTLDLESQSVKAELIRRGVSDPKVSRHRSLSRSLPKNMSEMVDTTGTMIPRRSVWTSSTDGSIKIWDIEEHNDFRLCRILMQDISPPEAIGCMKFVNGTIWAATKSSIFLYDKEGNFRGKFQVGEEEIPNCIVNTNSKHVWISYGAVLLVYNAHVFPAQGKMIKSHRRLTDHTTKISSMLYVDNIVWSCETSGDIILWSAELFEPVMPNIRKAHASIIRDIIICQQGRDDRSGEVWTCSDDNTVRIWDKQNMLCVRSIRTKTNVLCMAHVKRDVAGESTVWVGSGDHLGYMKEEAPLPTSRRLITYTNGDKYVGEIYAAPHVVARHGRGEFHSVGGDIYVGYWANDQNKDKYYGHWTDDKRQGYGVYVHYDGTCYEGEWKDDRKGGKGRLLLPNGDTLQGEWKGEDVIKATYVKGSTTNVPHCVEGLFRSAWKIPVNFEEYFGGKTLPMRKWSYFTTQQVKLVVTSLKHQYPANTISSRDLSTLLLNDRSCLGSSVAEFCYMFEASYHFTYGESSTLLHHAVDDVHSFLNGMSVMISRCFTNVNEKRCWQMISDVVFSKIYDSLFTLYKATNQSVDTLLTVKTRCLSQVTLEQLGTRPDLIFGRSGSAEPDSFLGNESEAPYLEAVNKLRQLSEFRTVSRKLGILKEASRTILQCISDHCFKEDEREEVCEEEGAPEAGLENSGYFLEDSPVMSRNSEEISIGVHAVGSEDKLPILLYCLIQARIPQLHSELCWMKEFALPQVFTSEAQYRLIELEQAITYLEFLEWNIIDEDGLLVSVSSLEKRISYSLLKSVNRMKNNESPQLLWISEVLLICGSRRSTPDDAYDFVLDREYNSYTRDDLWLDLINSVLEPLGVRLEREEGQVTQTRVHLNKRIPQYVYTKLARLLEEEIMKIKWSKER
ncbi:hypothetical protein PROFUN_08593 [Planoprotostelium fungivorum]|uniref:VPS9 domain-containing protein n=1 Tax=Planoprotostelium fungivorum TaxID=1890364 RepID=A0A2P6NJ65_9EUKA|nr:hypothetical protein PROFUN_08593 [Planoprotostelium fungivorum]